jgi:leucyl-tRNA synthetase
MNLFFFRKISEENKNYINLKENYKKILIVMSPIIPHFSNEYLWKN